MNIIRDAATLLILALLVMSVRVTTLDPVGDLLPSAEAAEAAQVSEASMVPAPATEKSAEPASVESESVMIFSIGGDADAKANPDAVVDCPIRTRTLRCTTAEDGTSRCELELQQVKTLVLPAVGLEAPQVATHTCT